MAGSTRRGTRGPSGGSRVAARRAGWRNGHRPRPFDPRLGALELVIAKLRNGSYSPDWLLEPRRRAERPRRGHPGGVREGRVDPQGRRPRAGHRRIGCQPERGAPSRRRPRRRPRGVPGAPARLAALIGTHRPGPAASMVAAFVRAVFARPDEPSARAQLRSVAERLAASPGPPTPCSGSAGRSSRSSTSSGSRWAGATCPMARCPGSWPASRAPRCRTC